MMEITTYSTVSHFLLHFFLLPGGVLNDAGRTDFWNLRCSTFLQEGEETMPLDPRIQAFLEQTGLLAQAGSLPREPMVLLAELRANDERAKAIVALASERAPVAHVENRVI